MSEQHMSEQPLTEQHLAELHARAQELGVPGFRMLSRDELIEAIEEADRGDSGASRDEASAP